MSEAKPNTGLGTRIPLKKAFEPLPDITAYELAKLLPYLIAKPLYQKDLDGLGTAARHCVDVEE